MKSPKAPDDGFGSGAYARKLQEIKKKNKKQEKAPARDPFAGMKWDSEFVKKIYFISQFGE